MRSAEGQAAVDQGRRLWLARSRMPVAKHSATAFKPANLQQILAAAIPASTVVGVYFLQKASRVVYVGQSRDVFARINAHRLGRKDFDSFSYVVCPAGDLNAVEAYYIEVFNPPLNVAKRGGMVEYFNEFGRLPPSNQ